MSVQTDRNLVSGNLQPYSHYMPSTLIQQTHIQQTLMRHLVNVVNILNSSPHSHTHLPNLECFFPVFPSAKTLRPGSMFTFSINAFSYFFSSPLAFLSLILWNGENSYCVPIIGHLIKCRFVNRWQEIDQDAEILNHATLKSCQYFLIIVFKYLRAFTWKKIEAHHVVTPKKTRKKSHKFIIGGEATRFQISSSHLCGPYLVYTDVS